MPTMWLVTMLALTMQTNAAPAKALPTLRMNGQEMVDPKGRPFTLKGCNAGNWLILEMWMLGMDPKLGFVPKDEYDLTETLTTRFGEAEKDRLMDLYRENWMRERDWKAIRSFGFNLVRLPFNYRLLEDDRRPMQLKPNAFKWLDRAVNEAEKQGLYVILDLHGIQGGQSVYDHTGRSGQNKVWTEPANQDRAAWLWGKIAARYKNRSAVVAYDLFNEPYGGTKPQQVELFKRLYPAVRAVDGEKLILAHGNYDNFDHYGDPKANGWKNVGFQMHFYPGLFGNGSPTEQVQAAHLRSMDNFEALQNKLNVPLLIGEFNVVFKNAGGANMMRRHYDTYAKHRWMATMWSYKTTGTTGGIGPDGWAMATNAKPLAQIDFQKDSLAAIESKFKAFGTVPLAINEPLRTVMTTKSPKLPPLPEPPARLLVAPANDPVPGFEASDIGGAKVAGGQRVEGSNITLYGAGRDIWGERDQFRFLSKETTGDFDLEVTVDSLADTGAYPKAGLMLRVGTDPSAATVLLSVFATAEVQMATRESAGGTMQGTGTSPGTFPGMRLRIERRGETITTFARTATASEWKEVGRAKLPLGPLRAGVIAASHADDQLTTAVFRDLRLTPR